MRILATAGAAVCLAWPAASVAAQVAPNGNGTVEFIGLQQWTPDALRRELGGAEQIHYCAANLLELGMADASVMYHSEGGRPYVVVTVVESELAGRVRYLEPIEGQAELEPAWRRLDDRLSGQGLEAQLAVIHYGRYAREGEEARSCLPDHADADRVLEAWRVLGELATATDFERATSRLAGDPNPRNRVCAAAVLMNFRESDEAWHALVRGLRDSDSSVRSACNQALLSMVRSDPRAVDWRPAADSLRWLLGGTNLFAFSNLLDVLVKTEVSSELASELLADNGHLLLAYFRAQHEYESQRAAALLESLRGEPMESAEAWERWIASLSLAR